MTTALIATTLWCAVLAAGDAGPARQDAAVNDPALRDFMAQTDRERPGESYQQAITVESLSLLASAIASLAQQNGAQVRLADDIARLRANIRGYRAGLPDDERQSARLRRTLVQASGLIDRLVAEARHERRASDPELNALRRAAESLDQDQSLGGQPKVIDRFLGHAAAILQRLDHRAARGEP